MTNGLRSAAPRRGAGRSHLLADLQSGLAWTFLGFCGWGTTPTCGACAVFCTQGRDSYLTGRFCAAGGAMSSLSDVRRLLARGVGGWASASRSFRVAPVAAEGTLLPGG
jgi:hypothetical protein